MKKTRDGWYVRTPDGRTLRANSTASVRHHLSQGTFPASSVARREKKTPWIPLREISAFSDLTQSPRENGRENGAPSAKDGAVYSEGVGAKIDPLRLHTVGVRGVGEELISALDNTLISAKIVTACLAGVMLLVIELLMGAFAGPLIPSAPWVEMVITGAIQLAVVAVTVAILTRLTHTEVSMMRPAEWSESTSGLLPVVSRLLTAYFLVPGFAFILLLVLRGVPGWIAEVGADVQLSAAGQEALMTGVIIVSVIVRVVLWVIIGMALLLGPVLVVEECSIREGIRQWDQLIRRHGLQIFVYEALAIALGLVVALPLALPIWLAWGGTPELGTNFALQLTQASLIGVAVGPFLAYLAVANVFIYLNLRYEYSSRGE